MVRWAWLIMILMVTTVDAADIQYRLSDGAVVGVGPSGSIATTPAEGVVTISEAEASIIWPVPTGQPAGTSCGTGMPQWTRITDAGVVTAAGAGMAVRPGLLFFKTTSPLLAGCHLVSTLAQLNRVYRQVLVDLMGPFAFLEALNDLAVVIARRCPGATGGANCDTARGNMATLDNDYPGAAAVANFSTNLVTLRTDKCTFQNTQGWGLCP